MASLKEGAKTIGGSLLLVFVGVYLLYAQAQCENSYGGCTLRLPIYLWIFAKTIGLKWSGILFIALGVGVFIMGFHQIFFGKSKNQAPTKETASSNPAAAPGTKPR
jgi:small neutral amino acid transporter SnatA (MarC family)